MKEKLRRELWEDFKCKRSYDKNFFEDFEWKRSYDGKFRKILNFEKKSFSLLADFFGHIFWAPIALQRYEKPSGFATGDCEFQSE